MDVVNKGKRLLLRADRPSNQPRDDANDTYKTLKQTYPCFKQGERQSHSCFEWSEVPGNGGALITQWSVIKLPFLGAAHRGYSLHP